MKIYHYHPNTFEYLGEDQAYPDPLEKDKFLIPAFAATIEPPAVQQKEIVVWEDNKWIVYPDFRGDIFYSKSTKQQAVINDIGDIPEDLTDKEPPDNTIWDYELNDWAISINSLVDRLEAEKQRYIDLHYPGPTRESLISSMLDPNISDEIKMQIAPAWQWIKTVIGEFFRARTEFVVNGKTWEQANVDFSQFDASDPHVDLEEILESQ